LSLIYEQILEITVCQVYHLSFDNIAKWELGLLHLTLLWQCDADKINQSNFLLLVKSIGVTKIIVRVSDNGQWGVHIGGEGGRDRREDEEEEGEGVEREGRENPDNVGSDW